MIEKYENYNLIKELITPVKIVNSFNVENSSELLEKKEPSVSFRTDICADFVGKDSWILLDFGKELCGGVRIITRIADRDTDIRITLGESVSEACSSIGVKNATNDHSPRDFSARIPFMSDLTFGLSGFRFVRIELLTDSRVSVQNIFAVSQITEFPREAVIKTADRALNEIIDTAEYTLRLNFQNGYIWDGIKRDRLVWCGDLHQEIISSLYLYGDNNNITNSLSFLRSSTKDDEWMNGMPTYSAWWVINFCDYCEYTGNKAFFEENRDYAEFIMNKINNCISDDGEMFFYNDPGQFFLDWPTALTPDAKIGTAMVIMLAAQRFLRLRDNSVCNEILNKLGRYLDADCKFKQTRAFQILAGGKSQNDTDFLEKGGAAGFSTFMTYYILTADAISGGQNMLEMIKEYFGGMLGRGATTFWEDFDISWLKGSGRIDEMPKDGEKDIHGDYGRYCYEGFRHSLCHGWSSGVISFIIESLFGIKYSNRDSSIEVIPHASCPEYDIKMPLENAWLTVSYKDGKIQIKAPDNIKIRNTVM